MFGFTGFERVKDPDLVEAVTVAKMVLPKKLRALREAQGLTTAEVARDTRVTKESISQAERGDFVPSLMRIVVLAAYYGVTVDYLIWDEECRK